MERHSPPVLRSNVSRRAIVPALVTSALAAIGLGVAITKTSPREDEQEIWLSHLNDNQDESPLAAGQTAQQVLMSLAKRGGGTLRLDRSIEINQTLVVPSGTRLLGVNPRTCVIKPSRGFAPASPLVRVGGQADEDSFYSRIEGVTLDCDHRVYTGLLSESLEELGGISDCRIINWLNIGMDLAGTMVMHTSIRDLWVYSSPQASAGSTGIKLVRSGGTIEISRVTVVGRGQQPLLACIDVISCPVVGISSSHFEGARSAVRLERSAVHAAEISGHHTVKNLVEVCDDFSRLAGTLLEPMGASVRVKTPTGIRTGTHAGTESVG